jgi:hypothetical protein
MPINRRPDVLGGLASYDDGALRVGTDRAMDVDQQLSNRTHTNSYDRLLFRLAAPAPI